MFDGPGFTAFYSAYAARVRKLLLNIGASPPDADDCTHDTLLAVWANRENIDGWPRCEGYLFTAARNHLYDHWRKSRHLRPVTDEMLTELPSTAKSPEEAADLALKRVALSRALRRLTPQQRRLLIDGEVHGVSPEELLHRYGAVSDGALRQARYRARRDLARLVPECAPALVAWPLVAYRRVVHAARSAWRSCADWVTGLGSQPQPLTVMLSALTLLVAPFGAGSATADPGRDPGGDPRPWTSPAPLTGPTLPTAPATPAGTEARATATDRATTPTLPGQRPVGPSRQPPTVTDPPSLCLRGKCPVGSMKDRDVITVHAPEPIGDYGVGTDAAPVCRFVPDTAVASCHTEGNPDYRVSPPPKRP